MSENVRSYQELTCKPLDTYEEILGFLQDPPSWRTLCTELRPHSDQAIRNKDINKDFGETFLETPQTFCHYKSETEVKLIKRHEIKKLPKTLVCHDLANGYHDDSIIDGTNNHEAYTFYNWGGIDIFCYFSHHLVTIPPLGWINVGHAHGVKVIGTLITEWSEGAAFWENILESDIEIQNFASALVAIAKTLKFDGWLLNVENKITKPSKLIEFVRLLHSVLHQELVDPVLIWYDSVTVDGHLNWQNGLNNKNRAFFEACDGIFTNYSWSVSDVEASAAAAGDRLTDVYVGIDVWGRNFYGGGQFNTQEAVKVAHNYGCSLAIFAPAWTHEALSDDSCDVNVVADEVCATYDQFLLRDRALWGSLWPFLNTKLPCMLPFSTSFCRGQGQKRRLYGEVVCPGPWYNLRHMQYQPNCAHGPHGYLLSVLENIIAVSRHGILNNKAGIVRCRRSLESSRMKISTKDDKEIVNELKSDNLTIIEENKTIIEVENSLTIKDKVDKENHVEQQRVEQKPEKTRKVSDVFRNLFKMKLSKEAEIQPDEESEPNLNKSSTKSMIQTSFNLRLGQNTHKMRLALIPVPEELECLEPFFEDSFIGGSCLKVNPSDKIDTSHRLTRMFHCNFYFEKAVIACVVTKTLRDVQQQYLNIELRAIDSIGRELKIILIGTDKPKAIETSSSEILYAYPLNSASDLGFRDIQKYMLLNEPGFYVPVENSYGWKVRYYTVPLEGARVLSVDCRTGLEVGPILLGHFGLCSRSEVST
ncbi:unnamed protein product [Parnassius mnemosyne]|uniref:Cytosolic endo-beta-N-acetylglucosaminidase TIM barrel domain-containing protein n=1 Tax=Parnassius mnemosyne TaxID=213953 RepID=A0AAV1LJP5_9NEOP